VQNQPFSEQRKIQKILVEEAGGEESDYESDHEEIPPPRTPAQQKLQQSEQPQYTKPP
jgi:hypothetical protein